MTVLTYSSKAHIFPAFYDDGSIFQSSSKKAHKMAGRGEANVDDVTTHKITINSQSSRNDATTRAIQFPFAGSAPWKIFQRYVLELFRGTVAFLLAHGLSLPFWEFICKFSRNHFP